MKPPDGEMAADGGGGGGSDSRLDAEDQLGDRARSYHREAARGDIAEKLEDTATLLRRVADRCHVVSGSIQRGGDLTEVEELVDTLIRSIPNWGLVALLADVVRYYRRGGAE